MTKVIDIKNKAQVEKISELASKAPYEVWLSTDTVMLDARSLLGLFALVGKKAYVVAEDDVDQRQFDKLAYVPVMISMVRSYICKEYTDVPPVTIVAVVSTLIYILTPIDLIPDAIPVIGYLDDLAVIAACWALVGSDVEAYIAWRQANGKVQE